MAPGLGSPKPKMALQESEVVDPVPLTRSDQALSMKLPWAQRPTTHQTSCVSRPQPTRNPAN
eukprot:scaffold7332_cov146-Amphora_coffeaeformis.AAC.2